MKHCILAVDIGTSGARAVLFDTQARALAQARVPYAMRFPRDGWAEQDPETVVQAVLHVLKAGVRALPKDMPLAAVVLSAQMYSILALSTGGEVLSPSLTWADTRSAPFAVAARARSTAELALRTGCPLQASYPLAKIMWLRAQGHLPPDARFVSIKDYVTLRLCGQMLADWSCASASGLLDIHQMQWDAEALALCGITPAHLPPLCSPRHLVRAWAANTLHYTGLPPEAPLILGAGDAPLANIGVGATAAGTLAVNIGTSAAARVLTTNPRVDAAGRLWTYVADEGHWTTGGIIGGGGMVYEWLVNTLLDGERGEQRFAEAERLAATVPAGADGLLFIPYFSGEQSPGWNPQARGLLFGLTLAHGRGHLLRAGIEGLMFALRRAADVLAGQSPFDTVYLTGGVTASPLWAQTLADVFGVRVVVPQSSESSARGAAILGWLALGAAADYAAFAQPEHALLPDAGRHTLYTERCAAFNALYEQMQK
ncbi:MAG: gluconokinase [Chloroflexi bacterium]|nr:gluconokinase [Chloroflexota bacterium]